MVRLLRPGLAHHVLGDLAVGRGDLGGRDGDERLVLLHHDVELADVDARVAAGARHVLVHLGDDQARLGDRGGRAGRGRAQRDVAEPVRRGDLDERHVDGDLALGDEARDAAEVGRHEAAAAGGDRVARARAVEKAARDDLALAVVDGARHHVAEPDELDRLLGAEAALGRLGARGEGAEDGVRGDLADRDEDLVAGADERGGAGGVDLLGPAGERGEEPAAASGGDRSGGVGDEDRRGRGRGIEELQLRRRGERGLGRQRGRRGDPRRHRQRAGRRGEGQRGQGQGQQRCSASLSHRGAHRSLLMILTARGSAARAFASA